MNSDEPRVFESSSDFAEGDLLYMLNAKNNAVQNDESVLFNDEDIETNKKLKDLLECPACREISITPIYLCQEGHNICGLCHPVIPSCPICNSVLTQVRNKMAEELIAKVRFKCRNADQGCDIISFGENFMYHLTNCDFRPISCFFPNCDVKIPFKSFLAHIENFHKVEGHEGKIFHNTITSSLNPEIDICTFTPGYIKAYGQVFLCIMQTFPNCFLCWATIFGQNCDPADYFAKITLIHPQNKKRQTSWVGPVHSFRARPEEIFESGNYLGLIIGPFKEFLDTVEETDGEQMVSWNCQFAVFQRTKRKGPLYLKNAADDLLNKNSSNLSGNISGDHKLEQFGGTSSEEAIDEYEEEILEQLSSGPTLEEINLQFASVSASSSQDRDYDTGTNVHESKPTAKITGQEQIVQPVLVTTGTTTTNTTTTGTGTGQVGQLTENNNKSKRKLVVRKRLIKSMTNLLFRRKGSRSLTDNHD